MDKFFTKFTPYVISFSVLILHLIGYVLDLYISRKYMVFLWAAIGAIDMIFAFRCGMLIKDLHMFAYTDKLTELYNRRFFIIKIVDEMKRIKESNKGVSLLMIDVDNFKKINDTYGHSSGDLVLKEIAKMIKSNIREKDTITRFGGEEFAIILPNTNNESAIIVAEKLRSIVECHLFKIKGDERQITISLGVVSVNEEVDSQLLVDFADRALYKAKERKNAVVFSPVGDILVQ